uniref:BICC1 first type I KH domain-containing protein n=1 Tax=Timema tahoe TaxID=61484 RepID=A0A7R9IJS7_9NEOP|nr:unnamed protein product [Timema tahoe]
MGGESSQGMTFLLEHSFGRRVENHLGGGKKPSVDLNRDSNSDLPVIREPVKHECDALDHSATEAGMHDEYLSAEIFFQKIMEDTLTHIMWPSRLKIGAKSKKGIDYCLSKVTAAYNMTLRDPHVRIAGRPDDVKAARERVTATLDIRVSRASIMAGFIS